MKERKAHKEGKKTEESLLKRTQNYVKNYARKCRDSYYWMLSL